jgi:hypothetical protein
MQKREAYNSAFRLGSEQLIAAISSVGRSLLSPIRSAILDLQNRFMTVNPVLMMKFPLLQGITGICRPEHNYGDRVVSIEFKKICEAHCRYDRDVNPNQAYFRPPEKVCISFRAKERDAGGIPRKGHDIQICLEDEQ